MNRVSIRARLTLAYGVAFLLAGVVLLVLTVALASRNLPAEPIRIQLEAPVDSVPTGGDIQFVPPADQLQTIDGRPLDDALQESAEAFRKSTLDQLRVQGLLALLVVGSIGFVVSWILAGRALRPVHQITSTARRLNHEHLGERIRLQGPPDELRDLADTFDEMLDRIEVGVEAERRFVANASHELRTPLTIERTVLEVALASGSDTDLRRAANQILATNLRTSRLVDALLLLASADAKALTAQRVQLSLLVEEQLGVDADVEWRTDLEPVWVDGDAALLSSLVANLVDNAVRYNADEDPWVAIEVAEIEQWAVLRVSNPGDPLTPATLATLTEPFERGPASRTAISGHGLGLAIVRTVAVAHGGTVTLEPLDGGGLSVEVRLPAAQ